VYRRPPQLWRYTDVLAEELQNVDLFLAPSEFTAREHARRGTDLPVRVLPYFLPTNEPPARGDPGGRDAGRPFFLFVGRLEKLKGADTLVEVFRDYDAADLVLVGDGRLARQLRRSAARLPHVRLLGFVHPADLWPLYQRAVALVVPSVAYEVFGIVALEAFAQGTPVIARHRGGLAELMGQSGGGFTYRTATELVEAMETLRLQPELRDELGARGRAAWLARWSEEPHLEAYFDAIEAVGAKVPAPSAR
jgi:glycosyltransferase involved in cell wall biosynthesis